MRARERGENYCTAWVLCQYCISADPFDSVQRKKFVSPKKKKKKCRNGFGRALVMEKNPCFPKLMSSMVTDSFLWEIWIFDLFLLRQSRI